MNKVPKMTERKRLKCDGGACSRQARALASSLVSMSLRSRHFLSTISLQSRTTFQVKELKGASRRAEDVLRSQCPIHCKPWRAATYTGISLRMSVFLGPGPQDVEDQR